MYALLWTARELERVYGTTVHTLRQKEYRTVIPKRKNKNKVNPRPALALCLEPCLPRGLNRGSQAEHGRVADFRRQR